VSSPRHAEQAQDRHRERRRRTRQFLLVALGHPQQRLGVAVGRPEETFPVGVLADAFEQRPDGCRQSGNVGLGLFRRRMEAEMRVLGCRR
jgi:hypothetical protein